MRSRCVLTVCGEIPKSWATSLVVAPYATFCRIWDSRRDSGVSVRWSPYWAYSMKARVSVGWITAFPSMASLAAWTSSSALTSFKRYPDTPARMASASAARDSSTVNRMTFVSGAMAMIWRVASIPLIPGRRTSMKMTSGATSLAAWTACSPLAASPTISTSPDDLSADRSPSLVTGWSSTIITRMSAPQGAGRGAFGPVAVVPSPPRIVREMVQMSEAQQQGNGAAGDATSDPTTLKEQVLEVLKNVHDPELGINIVDLGLVYGVQ